VAALAAAVAWCRGGPCARRGTPRGGGSLRREAPWGEGTGIGEAPVGGDGAGDGESLGGGGLVAIGAWWRRVEDLGANRQFGIGVLCRTV